MTISLRTRRCLKRLPLFLLSAFLLLILYSRFIEIRWLTVTRVPVQLPHLPPAFHGLKVALLSDLHYPEYLSPAYFARVVRITNAQHPDLIVLTGDFVPDKVEQIEPCARILGELRAPLGVYAVLGNHDYWLRSTDRLTRAFAQVKITMLRNTSLPLTQQQSRLWLVGLDDFWAGSTDLRKALRGIPPGDVKILLVHEPDFAAYAAQEDPSIALQLSGHSHGGQVRFPFVGGVHYPPLGERYPRGLYQVGPLQVYTNSGVGLILPFRLGCRPEITVLTLNGPGR